MLDKKLSDADKVIALAGNPNVGKSTVFNNLTGMNQHTGNWPGKTVTNAQGYCKYKNKDFLMVDLPGTYSLMAHSAEEEVARDFICFGDPDCVVVICDATCLERNMNLVLQTIEITDNIIVCINFMDEAKKKNIRIDTEGISKKLGVPVLGIIARKNNNIDKLLQLLNDLPHSKTKPIKIKYTKPIEDGINILEPVIKDKVKKKISSRWLSIKLLDTDAQLGESLNRYIGYDILSDNDIQNAIKEAETVLFENGITKDNLRDKIVSGIVLAAEDVCLNTVKFENCEYNLRDRKIDKLLTGKFLGFPLMIVMLMVIFWLTITGSNYPSKILSDFLFMIEDKLTDVFQYFNAPGWLHGIIVLGAYRVLAWVVSVMLPPMAIFFPLFTILEDLGYLPRVAFNLDKYFKKCSACGKQALTMCMGFGCNAAGVIGCRIIDSPRERLIAIITNNFVPCNGRFPTLIAIITMFFVGTSARAFSSLLSALILTMIILLGILMTFLLSRFLSKTVLKGEPSSFTLEMPPYRRPQICKVIVRSVFDRTLYVLGRAITVAAPAGVIIWIMANVTIKDVTLLSYCAGFLDPFANLMGLDGVILIAFILGFPANEIVFPIIIMAYMASGSLMKFESLNSLKELLVNNGWTYITATNVMLFSLMHWPCSTTCLTIKKETQSLKWTVLSAIIPTSAGILLCITVTSIARLFYSW